MACWHPFGLHCNLRGDIQFPRAQNTYTRMPYMLTMLTDPVNVALVFDQIESGSAGVRWFSTGLVERALKWRQHSRNGASF
jgi:hypothetical protein